MIHESPHSEAVAVFQEDSGRQRGLNLPSTLEEERVLDNCLGDICQLYVFFMRGTEPPC